MENRQNVIKLFSYLLCCLSIGLFFNSCNNRTFQNREELVQYLVEPENGFIQSKNINGVDFTITCRPTDLLVYQELSSKYDVEEISRLRKKYDDYMYLNLSISNGNEEILSSISDSRASFGKMVNQLSFNMDSKTYLVNQKKDTIELMDFNYPRNYGMGKSTDIIFVYRKNNNTSNSSFLEFTIEDFGLKTGDVRFKIPIKSFQEQPKIAFH